MRAELAAARAAAQAAQQRARELALQVESRRSSHASLRRRARRAWRSSCEELTRGATNWREQLADGEAPLAGAHGAARAGVAGARADRGGAAAPRRSPAMSSTRCCASARRSAPRSSSRSRRRARPWTRRGLAAQQVRVRRESVAEQLAAHPLRTCRPCSPGLRPEATVEAWESQLEETQGQDRAPGSGESRGDRRIQGAIGAQGISGPPVQGSDRRPGDAGVGDAQDRSGNAHPLPGHLRPGQRRPQGEISAPVRRRPCLPGADGRGVRGGRRVGDGAPARASATAPSASCRAARRR